MEDREILPTVRPLTWLNLDVPRTHNDPARSMLPANSPNTQLALRTCCGQSELRAQAAALGTSATRPPKIPRKLELPSMHNGNEANCDATSCCSALPNSSPRRDNIARCGLART